VRDFSRTAYVTGSSGRFVLGADDTRAASGDDADMTATARQRLLSPLVAATCGLIAAALLVAGCGPPPDRNAPDGTTVTQDGVDYAVQTSRELNPDDADDRAFLGGRTKGMDAPGTTLLGVFLHARNDASAPRRALAAPQLVDAFGRTFEPVPLPATDPFAYRGRLLAPGQEISVPQSVARESPENGSILVYRVPTGIFVSDRPFTLRFGTDDRAASVQLDL
jgi:hypothetical protein